MESKLLVCNNKSDEQNLSPIDYWPNWTTQLQFPAEGKVSFEKEPLIVIFKYHSYVRWLELWPVFF